MATPASPSNEIQAVYLRGVRYEPAWKHYGNECTVVTCDRCGATALEVCMGLDDTDLCIPCVDTLRTEHERVRTRVKLTVDNRTLRFRALLQAEKASADAAEAQKRMEALAELSVVRMMPSDYSTGGTSLTTAGGRQVERMRDVEAASAKSGVSKTRNGNSNKCSLQ